MMSARRDFTYSNFLGDLDEFLAKCDPTLEELEVQVFGKPYIQFTTHRAADVDILSTGRWVIGHLDQVLTQ